MFFFLKITAGIVGKEREEKKIGQSAGDQASKSQSSRATARVHKTKPLKSSRVDDKTTSHKPEPLAVPGL